MRYSARPDLFEELLHRANDRFPLIQEDVMPGIDHER